MAKMDTKFVIAFRKEQKNKQKEAWLGVKKVWTYLFVVKLTTSYLLTSLSLSLCVIDNFQLSEVVNKKKKFNMGIDKLFSPTNNNFLN